MITNSLSRFSLRLMLMALAGLTLPLQAGVPVLSWVPPVGPVPKGGSYNVRFTLSEPAPAGGAYVDYKMGGVPGLPLAVMDDDYRFESPVTYSELNGKAVPQLPGRLFFGPGKAEVTVTIGTMGDEVHEPDKWLRFEFGEPRGLTLAPGWTADMSIRSRTAESFNYFSKSGAPQGECYIRGFSLEAVGNEIVKDSLNGRLIPGDWGVHPTLAAADVIPGDGKLEMIVGSGAGVPARFAVFRQNESFQNVMVLEEFPYAKPNGQAFEGGLWLAAADFNGDGLPDIVTVPRQNPSGREADGTDAKVQIWDVARSIRNDGGNTHWRIWERTLAAPVPGIGQSAGFHVAAGDVTGDGVNDVIIGNGPGLPPMVQIWAYTGNFQTDPSGFNRTHLFPIFNTDMTTGVYLSTADYNRDGRLDLVAGSGSTFRIHRTWILPAGSPPEDYGDVWQDRTWDGIHHVKVQDINTGAVLFDRQTGDEDGDGVIDRSDPSDDTFVFGGKGFAGFMRGPSFDFRAPWEIDDIPAGPLFLVAPGAGNTATVTERRDMVNLLDSSAGTYASIRPIVRALPLTIPAPLKKLPPAPPEYSYYGFPPVMSISRETGPGVRGMRVRFDHRNVLVGYLPVIEWSDDLLTWTQVDARELEWDFYVAQELFVPATATALHPKRYYRGRLINLDATP